MKFFKLAALTITLGISFNLKAQDASSLLDPFLIYIGEKKAPDCDNNIKIADNNQIQNDSGKTLCCCQTLNGGQCCNYTQFCGNFIPGCFCR